MLISRHCFIRHTVSHIWKNNYPGCFLGFNMVIITKVPSTKSFAKIYQYPVLLPWLTCLFETRVWNSLITACLLSMFLTGEGNHWMITSPHTKTYSISQMICDYDRCVCAVTFKWGNILLSTPHYCGDMTSVSLSQKVSSDPGLLFCLRDRESSVLHFEWCEKYPVATEDSLKRDNKFLFLQYFTI